MNGWADISEPDPIPQLHFGEGFEAKRLMDEKKWPEAVVVLRSMLKRSPGVASLELDLTRSLVYSGRREEALTTLSQMITRKKSSARKAMIARVRVLSRVFLTNASFQVYQDGVNLMLAGKYRPARERFEKALEQEPANIETLARLGQCLVMDGDYDSAAENLRLARRLNPFEPEVRLWLGRTLHQRGEIREAIVELKSAYQDLPNSETAAIWYSAALFSLGQSASSIQVLEDDLRRHPNHIGALIELSRHRMVSTSPRDAQSAWQARKDLQLALSRVSLYFVAEKDSDAVDAMDDLALDLRRTEAQLRDEIGKLLAEATNRTEGGLPER